MKKITYEIFNEIAIDGIALSKREAECMYYLMRGMTAKQIGNTIYLSRRTVEGHILNLRNKLQCRTKFELIDCALKSIFPFKRISEALVN